MQPIHFFFAPEKKGKRMFLSIQIRQGAITLTSDRNEYARKEPANTYQPNESGKFPLGLLFPSNITLFSNLIRSFLLLAIREVENRTFFFFIMSAPRSHRRQILFAD